MPRFKILPHTADLRVQVFGRTEEELFRNAALALRSVLYEGRVKKPPGGFEKIVVLGNNINELLVNFLSEILTRSQIDRKIYERVKILRFSPTSLEAHIFGIPVDHFDEDVKAVTHHGVDIQKNKRGAWETTVILDI